MEVAKRRMGRGGGERVRKEQGGVEGEGGVAKRRGGRGAKGGG